jgi:hypothetical protein
MTLLKGAALAALGAVLITAGIVVFQEVTPEIPAIPPPTLVEKAAVRAEREKKTRIADLNAAVDGCEQWTKAHDKPSADKIVRRYEVTEKPVKLKREYWVRVDYRAQGNAKLMLTECHYVAMVGKVVLLEARTAIKY